MAASILRLCLLVLCLALLHATADSIRPLAQAALLPTSEPGHRGLLSLISEYKFDSEVEKALASSARRRRSLKKDPVPISSPATSPTASVETSPAADAPPPTGGVAHTDYVYEGY